MTGDLRIAIYGEVDLNVVDGAAIWLQSLALALAARPRTEVIVVCRSAERRDLLTRPLRDHSRVRVVNPVDLGWAAGPSLGHVDALAALARLDDDARLDAVILRGMGIAHAAATAPGARLAGRMWAYLTDLPQRAEELTADALGRLRAIVDAAGAMLCQTEALRAYLEATVPAACGKSLLVEPILPDEPPARRPPPGPLAPDAPLRLIYVGKLAPRWKTLEMVAVTARLRARGVAVELDVVGDKLHRPASAPGWADAMARALAATPGVRWHGARSRQDTLALLAEHDVALGYRAADLDDSLELSTKLLEYGAAGVPAIVNRTVMHEELLGADYPLFAGSDDELAEVITAARDPEVRRLAAARGAAASRRFTMSAAAARVRPVLDGLAAGRPGPAIALAQLARAKTATAPFHLAVVGADPWRRGLDRALDVLARLRDVDDRYQLHVKGVRPWEDADAWRDPAARDRARALLARIHGEPRLRGAVHLDAAGPDVAGWLRGIGFVLAADTDADDADDAAAMLDAIATGAVPVVVRAPDRATRYPAEALHADDEAAVAAILAVGEDGAAWAARSAQARAWAASRRADD